MGSPYGVWGPLTLDAELVALLESTKQYEFQKRIGQPIRDPAAKLLEVVSRPPKSFDVSNPEAVWVDNVPDIVRSEVVTTKGPMSFYQTDEPREWMAPIVMKKLLGLHVTRGVLLLDGGRIAEIVRRRPVLWGICKKADLGKRRSLASRFFDPGFLVLGMLLTPDEVVFIRPIDNLRSEAENLHPGHRDLGSSTVIWKPSAVPYHIMLEYHFKSGAVQDIFVTTEDVDVDSMV
ncbi:MAG: hypothetical protein MMC23_007511 [Stictis urceolatum]|nr:hypothetical protein [Stictis urceolata]